MFRFQQNRRPFFSIELEESKIFLALMLLFYLIVAYKSSGYHQEDEHYQIIEFANYKLGLLPADRLAWEFEAKIRPGFQPLLCYFLFKFFAAFGIANGYTLAFLLRAVTAVIAIGVVQYFIKAYRGMIAPSLRPLLTIMSYLLWFLPYINVRFSSETWSGFFILITLAFLRNNRYSVSTLKLLFLGILLGTAVLFRYQAGLIVAGIGFWLIFVERYKFRELTLVACGFLIMQVVGLFCDNWLYGEYTLSIYNYFFVNIVRGVSANFGVSPWYQYIIYVFAAAGLFGPLILASFIILLRYKINTIILWAIVPFILVHSLIPHKELRFLFSIAEFAPLLLFLAYQEVVKRKLLLTGHFDWVKVTASVLLIMVNLAGLISIATTGAGTCRTVVTEYINRNYAEQKIRIIVVGEIHPYMDWGPPKNSFYSSSGLDIKYSESVWKEDFLSLIAKNKTSLLIISEIDAAGPKTKELLKNFNLVKVYQNLSPFVQLIYKIYDPGQLDFGMCVYEAIPKASSF